MGGAVDAGLEFFQQRHHRNYLVQRVQSSTGNRHSVCYWQVLQGCQRDVLTLTWSPVGLEDGFPIASAPSWPRSQQGSLLHCWFRPAGQPLDAVHAIRHRGDGVGWTLIAIQSRIVAKDVLVDCRILRTHSPLTLQ